MTEVDGNEKSMLAVDVQAVEPVERMLREVLAVCKRLVTLDDPDPSTGETSELTPDGTAPVLRVDDDGKVVVSVHGLTVGFDQIADQMVETTPEVVDEVGIDQRQVDGRRVALVDLYNEPAIAFGATDDSIGFAFGPFGEQGVPGVVMLTCAPELRPYVVKAAHGVADTRRAEARVSHRIVG